METTPPTPIEMLMFEVAENLEALVARELANIAQPPRGSIKDTGHYRLLQDAKLNRKQSEALNRVLETLAYNVASTIFATLDGDVKTDFENFPRLALVEQGSTAPISESLRMAFTSRWDEEGDSELSHPHPD
ncbi:MAG: hypothetical protein H0T73_08860 [Ardenticatenales bacterium]|nr:hypothetical protein [Ardenticatenales bacterium]